MRDSATTCYSHAPPVGPASWWFSLLLLIAALALAPGCGQRQAQQEPPERPAQTADVPLPDWAPENPSPEFLRAAKMLKPMPESAAPDRSATEIKKRQAMKSMVHTALYELFGALSDEQLQEFLDSGETRIPMEQLTTSQRRAVDAFFEGSREYAEDGYSHGRDYLVMLYKAGAAQDLSNVDVGFQSMGHQVSFYFWIQRPDGREAMLGMSLAYM